MPSASKKSHSHLFMPGFDICSRGRLTELFVAGHNMTNINQRISPDSGHLIFTKEILGDNCYPLGRCAPRVVTTTQVRRAEETT